MKCFVRLVHLGRDFRATHVCFISHNTKLLTIMANLTCMALNCTSSSKNNEGLRFHRIPSDAARRKEWIIACKRTDLMEKPPSFFKHKYVCGLHFTQFATPSLHWIATSRDSCTQTWESIKFLGATPDTSKLPAIPDLKKIEVRTSHTQTEEFILCANRNLEVMKENDITIKSESKVKENETEQKEEESDEAVQISKDTDQESQDETSKMSIDEFLELNDGLENQIREVLKKENIPQTPILKETNSRANWIRFHKEIQTDNVIIYMIPKNNRCFQQCLRCGKNASRLAPRKKKPDHLITLEDFLTASKRFLTPEFCATVKNQIQIEQQLNQLHEKKNPLHDA